MINFGTHNPEEIRVLVAIRTNDFLERPCTGSVVIIGQVFVRQDVHTDRLVEALRRVMHVNLQRATCRSNVN